MSKFIRIADKREIEAGAGSVLIGRPAKYIWRLVRNWFKESAMEPKDFLNFLKHNQNNPVAMFLNKYITANPNNENKLLKYLSGFVEESRIPYNSTGVGTSLNSIMKQKLFFSQSGKLSWFVRWLSNNNRERILDTVINGAEMHGSPATLRDFCMRPQNISIAAGQDKIFELSIHRIAKEIHSFNLPIDIANQISRALIVTASALITWSAGSKGLKGIMRGKEGVETIRKEWNDLGGTKTSKPQTDEWLDIEPVNSGSGEDLDYQKIRGVFNNKKFTRIRISQQQFNQKDVVINNLRSNLIPLSQAAQRFPNSEKILNSIFQYLKTNSVSSATLQEVTNELNELYQTMQSATPGVNIQDPFENIVANSIKEPKSNDNK